MSIDTGAKTQARHAIELIADWYDGEDEGYRAVQARRTPDAGLLDVIKGVLQDLANTQAAYMNEKGNSRQLEEIDRLKDELTTARSPQADVVAALNKRLIAANEEIDSLRMQLARGIECASTTTEGRGPEGDEPDAACGTRPEATAPEQRALERDAALLDWFDANPALVGYAQGYHGSPSAWSWRDQFGAHRDAADLREAIANARTAQQAGKEQP